MEERKIVEKRTVEERSEVERADPVVSGVKNVNVGPDGSAQVQESGDVVDEPVGMTTVREERVVEERRD